MEKSNFALISALYDTTSGGLYNDVYFPIIKYTVVNLFYDEKLRKDYYTISDIQEFMSSKFDIKIPSFVLQKAINKLANKEKDNFEFNLYDNGKEFQIKKAWDISTNISIDEKYQSFTRNFDILESKYQKYLMNESIEEDKKFIDFISDNTDDILGYFEDNDTNKVDEKYTTIAYFLEFLNKHDLELFKIANQLFWGSIIAGFLKRNNPEIDSPKESNNYEYYLDTSLVMALIRLSTPEHETYANEMLGIIISSGGIARVNPMTLKEITNIVQSVETQGYPNLNTEIASAYERYQLNNSKLANIRVNLIKILDSIKVSTFPRSNDYDVKKTINEYKCKPIIIELNKSRKTIATNNDDTFREIHDIYMDDFIRSRKDIKHSENIYFVTLNKDLINFCKGRHENNNVSNMIHPGKIIVDLWMHNSKCSTISTQVLTETIARCLILNDKDVRHKLGIVAKYYNVNSDNFDPETYKAIIIGLYKRSRSVIKYIDEVEDLDKSKEYDKIHQKLRCATNAAIKFKDDNLDKSSRLQEIIEERSSMEKKYVTKIHQLENQNTIINTNLNKLKQVTQTLYDNIQKQDQRIKHNDDIIADKEKEIEKLKEKDNLSGELLKLNQEYEKMRKEKENSFTYIPYYMWNLYIYITSLICLVTIILIVFYKYSLTNLITFLLGLFGFLNKNIKDYIIDHKNSKENFKRRREDNWVYKHPEFKEMETKITSLKAKIDSIDYNI